MTNEQLKAAADYLREYQSDQQNERETYNGYASRQRRYDPAIAELGELADALEQIAFAAGTIPATSRMVPVHMERDVQYYVCHHYPQSALRRSACDKGCAP